jgi:hypothetical protein
MLRPPLRLVSSPLPKVNGGPSGAMFRSRVCFALSSAVNFAQFSLAPQIYRKAGEARYPILALKVFAWRNRLNRLGSDTSTLNSATWNGIA